MIGYVGSEFDLKYMPTLLNNFAKVYE